MCQLFSCCLGTEYRFQGIGIVACVPGLSAYGHGRRGEILHLFEVEIEVFRDDSEFSHILFPAAGMAADEIGDDLLSESFFLVDLIEDALKLIELVERRLAHELEHLFGGVFRCHFQSSADMLAYQFAGIFACRLVVFRVFVLVE